jgi:hypothetical protein
MPALGAGIGVFEAKRPWNHRGYFHDVQFGSELI